MDVIFLHSAHLSNSSWRSFPAPFSNCFTSFAGNGAYPLNIRQSMDIPPFRHKKEERVISRSLFWRVHHITGQYWHTSDILLTWHWQVTDATLTCHWHSGGRLLPWINEIIFIGDTAAVLQALSGLFDEPGKYADPYNRFPQLSLSRFLNQCSGPLTTVGIVTVRQIIM